MPLPAPALVRAVTGALLAALLLAPAAGAQGTWLDRDHPRTVQLEALHPFIAHFDEKWTTSTWFLSTRQQLGGGPWHAVVDLPFAHAAYDYTPFVAYAPPGPGDVVVSETSTLVGRPYLGVELKPGDTGGWLEFGIRPNVGANATEFATVTGVLTDVERWEAFYDHLWTVRLGLHNRVPVARGQGYLDVHVAPAVWIGTGAYGESDLLATYGVHLRSRGTYARVGGGLSGRIFITVSGPDLGERTWHQADFAADFLAGRVRPGVTATVPLDEGLTNSVDAAIGFSLNVILP